MRGASACIIVGDGTLAFQRRDRFAPTNPNKLALFGGAHNTNENPHDAITRELREETSITFQDEDVEEIFSYFRADIGRMQYIFKLEIFNVDFKVFEGKAVEWFTPDEVLGRSDTTNGLREAIKRYKTYVKEN